MESAIRSGEARRDRQRDEVGDRWGNAICCGRGRGRQNCTWQQGQVGGCHKLTHNLGGGHRDAIEGGQGDGQAGGQLAAVATRGGELKQLHAELHDDVVAVGNETNLQEEEGQGGEVGVGFRGGAERWA